MSLRWQFERDSRFFVPYKVEIFDSEYNGSPITLENVGGDPLEIEMGRQGADPDEKIKASFCTVRLFGQSGDFEDLFSRDLNRFKIRVYIDGEFDSEFIPLPDTFNDYIQGGNYTVEIKGANLSLLKQRDAWTVLDVDEENPGVVRKLNCIIDLINDIFDLNVVDGSIYYPESISQNGSSLINQFIQFERIEGMNSYQALELLIPKGHQYRVGRGKVWIIPQQEATWTGYEYSTSGFFQGSHEISQNFVAVFKGGRYSVPRTKLPQYDGVRRIYNPLEGENAIPSGQLLPEDFGIENPSQEETVQFPQGWQRINYPGGLNTHLVSSTVGSNRWAWRIPESFPLSTGFVPVHYRAQSKQVSAGQRLLIKMTLNYQSRNGFAIFPVIIRIGDQILRNDYFIVGDPQWQQESALDEFNTYDVGMTANTGYSDFEILTPPIPATGEFRFDIFSPSPDGVSWRISNEHYLDIAELTAEVADENGDILLRDDTLAGGKGSVYEYTEGFGDGFSSFHPGAIFLQDPRISINPTIENLTELWNLKGEAGDFPLSEIETKYLYSQLSRDLDRISGTADVFDTIALIEGKRVNYISTNFRYGNSSIELVEIREHDLEATIEKRRELSPGRHGGGGGSPIDLRPDLDRLQAIGEITRDYENEETDTLDCDLDQPLRKGIEYWIVNEAELSRVNRFAGVYAVIPQTTDTEGNRLLPDDENYDDETNIKEYGPGLTEVPIQEQFINAPEGSLIFKAPGQDEIERNIGEEKDREFDGRIEDLNKNLDQLVIDLDELNTVTLPALNEELDQLEADLNTLNTVTLPALQSELDDNTSALNTLNTVTLPALQEELDDNTSAINTLNTVTLPALQDDLNDNSDAINTLNTVTLPNLQSELDDILPITETKISDNAISAPKLQANSVVAGKIAANAVVADSIASNSITTNKINAGAVVADKIATDAVTADKILANSVTTNKINSGAITTDKIGANQVVANSIASNAVTTNKINAGAVVTDKIAANAVTANEIAANAVIANKIQAGAVIAGKIGADAVVANNIAADAVTTNKIGAGQVTALKIDVDDLAANSAFIDELMAQTLIIRSGGSISNANNDFLIDDNGVRVRVSGSSNLDTSKSFQIRLEPLSSGGLIGALWGRPGSVLFESTNSSYDAIMRSARDAFVRGRDVSLESTRDVMVESDQDTIIESDRYFQLKFNESGGSFGANVRFDSAANSGTDGRPEAGRIVVNVNGVERLIKLYGL